MAKQDDEARRGAQRGGEPARQGTSPAERDRREAAVEGLSGVGPTPYDPNRPEPLEDVGLQDPSSPPEDEERRLESTGAASDAGAPEDASEKARAAQDESFAQNAKREPREAPRRRDGAQGEDEPATGTRRR